MNTDLYKIYVGFEKDNNFNTTCLNDEIINFSYTCGLEQSKKKEPEIKDSNNTENIMFEKKFTTSFFSKCTE
jgi:hypothetical protein